jgi:hypothetical protein
MTGAGQSALVLSRIFRAYVHDFTGSFQLSFRAWIGLYSSLSLTSG